MEKRCERCGRVADVRPRERRCKWTRVPGGYACWGRLVRVKPAPKAKRRKPAERGVREEAAYAAARAMLMVDRYTKAVAAATRKLVAWNRKVSYYTKRAAMTDAEVEQERRRLADAAAKRGKRRMRRGINFKEE